MDLTTSFSILGLDPHADPAAAKRAYKALVRRWHPDQFPAGSATKGQAEERLKLINIAYARVRDHLERRPPPSSPRPREQARTASKPSPDRSDVHGAEKKAQKRSWVDHLFDRLNAFTESGASTDPTPSSGSHRRRSFQQVLGEMAGEIPASGRRPAPSGGRPACRVAPAQGQRCRRSGDSSDGVSPIERISPIRPVGRVRGIGRKR